MTDKNINSVKSSCPNKNVCGSCEWSEVTYDEQLKRKLDGINESFLLAGFSYKAENIVASPKTSHYRNRMDFVIDYEGRFGMREKGKWWKVIDGHTCFISEEKIETAFWKCKEWLGTCGLSFLDRKSWKGLLSYIVIRCTKAGELMINVVTGSDFLEEEAEVISEKLLKLAEMIGCTTLVWSINHTKSDISFGSEVRIITGLGFITEEIGGFKYMVTPNSFFQTNSYSAEKLQSLVMNFAKLSGAQNILDLYCGSGFFTFPLSKLLKTSVGKVLGIEMVEEAVETAKKNIELNKNFWASAKNDSEDKNISARIPEFVCEKSEDLSWKNFPADLIVFDPPRSGLHNKVLETLMKNPSKNIIYVSCNYKKFIEELKILSEKYELKKSTAIDMFPHTPHVELVSLLTVKY